MESTAAVLASIARSAQPEQYADLVVMAQLVSALGAVIAVIVATVALTAESTSRSKAELLQLVDYYDRAAFFTRIWRVEQLTRTKGACDLEPKAVEDILGLQKPLLVALFKEALASDWSVDRADMFSLYFYALRVRAWVHAGRFARRRVRTLNDTFGHQLLSTLLSHRAIACRLRKSGVPDNYYPTYYGLFDSAYAELVADLAADLFRPGRLQPAIARSLRDRQEALIAYIKTLRPLSPKEDPGVISDGRKEADAGGLLGRHS